MLFLMVRLGQAPKTDIFLKEIKKTESQHPIKLLKRPRLESSNETGLSR